MGGIFSGSSSPFSTLADIGGLAAAPFSGGLSLAAIPAANAISGGIHGGAEGAIGSGLLGGGIAALGGYAIPGANPFGDGGAFGSSVTGQGLLGGAGSQAPVPPIPQTDINTPYTGQFGSQVPASNGFTGIQSGTPGTGINGLSVSAQPTMLSSINNANQVMGLGKVANQLLATPQQPPMQPGQMPQFQQQPSSYPMVFHNTMNMT